MDADIILPRLIEGRLEEALSDSPVVLVHGPRQCGKTTLVRRVGGRRGYTYMSLDAQDVRTAAQTDPIGFVADLPERVILDEIQLVPDLASAIKMVVDRERVSGRFVLTGSSNVLALPRLSDSLAGRMALLRLHPLAQCELEGSAPAFLDALFDGTFRMRKTERLGMGLAARIVAGGYPAALARTSQRRRAAWYREYVETIVQRDVREYARVSSLDTLSKLLALAAGQTARLLNVSELSAPFELSRPTIRDYITLLTTVFLVHELPPWHDNRLSRLVKRPKVHVGDTGVAASLLGVDEESAWEDRELLGQLLETFVVQELRRQASGHADDFRFHHFRDKEKNEVDVVIERGRLVAGVETKASATVTPADFRGLRKLASTTGRRFAAGVVLYDGETALPFGDRLHAVPVSALWSP